MSQEALAFDAEISTRHLSCLESGKAQPSRAMVLVLASALEMPLRERNVLLHAAGFAAVYRQSGLSADEMAPITRALDALLSQQEPYGAVVVDRNWDVVRMNDGAQRILARFPSSSTDPRIVGNVMRGFFHPGGIRPHVVNWNEVALLLLERAARERLHAVDNDALGALYDEIRTYADLPVPGDAPVHPALPIVAVHLKNGPHEVRIFSTLTTLGTPVDVTAQELAIESYFPLDEESARTMQRWAEEATS
jgi:transcriptional regulator with XRE-family HTH domain